VIGRAAAARTAIHLAVVALAGQSWAAARDPALVLAQFPITPSKPARAGDVSRGELGDEGRVVVVSPGQEPRVLSEGFHSAADPHVAFDGRTVLFAGRWLEEDPWCIWETDARGAPPRRVTCGPGGARHPIALPTLYTLNPKTTDAWDQIAFVGTLPGETNEAGSGPHTALFTCTRNGDRLRRISFNLSSDFDPTLLPDGRLLFASRQRRSLRHGPRGRVALFALQTDGVDLALFSGDEGGRFKRMPAYAGRRTVVFVEGDAVEGDGGGALAAVSLRRNLQSHQVVGKPGEGLYHSPSAGPAGGVLVSWRGEDGQYAVYRIDPVRGAREALFDDPRRHDVQAQVLASRPIPDRRSSSVQDSDPQGGLYGLDVAISDLGRDAFPPGTARRLRVLEGVPRSTDAPAEARATRRLLGESELASDGSFHVQVPADTPLELQLLDEDGLALRSCGWIWVRSHEQRGCIGCHEDPERTPPNRFVRALETPAAEMAPPPEARRTVRFDRDVEPIVAKRCLSCHGAGGSPPRLDADPGGALARYIEPGRARASPLAWHVLGRVTLRPWDAAPDGAEAAVAPGGMALTPEERRTILAWIDLGAARGGAR